VRPGLTGIDVIAHIPHRSYICPLCIMTVSRNYIDGIEKIEIGIRFHRLTIIRWSRWVPNPSGDKRCRSLM
jgi:hypothetical protein